MDVLPLPISTLPQPVNIRKQFDMAPERDTGYEARVMEAEGRALKYYTDISNRRAQAEEQEKLITNMSITAILQQISATIIAIINDLSSGNVKTAGDLALVFFRDNRMMYLGIVALFIGFSIYVVESTT